MARFHSFRVYQVARENLAATYRMVAGLRGEWSLRDQMKRAATSVVSNICEGSERGNDKELRQFLVIARASNGELTGQWQSAMDCGLVDEGLGQDMLARLERCGRMLSAFIKRIDETR